LAGNTAYALSVTKDADADFRAHFRKNKPLAEAVESKINEILQAPHRFKPLRHNLAGCYRVHVLGSFVLIYQVNEKSKSVQILRFAHHDDAYRL